MHQLTSDVEVNLRCDMLILKHVLVYSSRGLSCTWPFDPDICAPTLEHLIRWFYRLRVARVTLGDCLLDCRAVEHSTDRQTTGYEANRRSNREFVTCSQTKLSTRPDFGWNKLIDFGLDFHLDVDISAPLS